MAFLPKMAIVKISASSPPCEGRLCQQSQDLKLNSILQARKSTVDVELGNLEDLITKLTQLRNQWNLAGIGSCNFVYAFRLIYNLTHRRMFTIKYERMIAGYHRSRILAARQPQGATSSHIMHKSRPILCSCKV